MKFIECCYHLRKLINLQGIKTTGIRKIEIEMDFTDYNCARYVINKFAYEMKHTGEFTPLNPNINVCGDEFEFFGIQIKLIPVYPFLIKDDIYEREN